MKSHEAITVALVMAFVVSALACKRGADAPPAPAISISNSNSNFPASAPAPVLITEPAAILARLKGFQYKALLDRSQYEATSQNMSSHLSSIRRYKNIFEWEGIVVRIPEAPWKEQLTDRLLAAMKEIGVASPEVTVTERSIQRRALPATIPEGPAFEFADDDVRGILDVRVRAKQVDADKAKKLLGTIESLDRIVRVGSFVERAGEVDVALETYYFVPVTPPTMIPRPRELAADLRAAGLDLTRLEAMPEARTLLEEARNDYAKMAKRAKDYTESMAMFGQLQLWNAKLNFVRKLTGEPRKRGHSKPR